MVAHLVPRELVDQLAVVARVDANEAAAVLGAWQADDEVPEPLVVAALTHCNEALTVEHHGVQCLTGRRVGHAGHPGEARNTRTIHRGTVIDVRREQDESANYPYRWIGRCLGASDSYSSNKPYKPLLYVGAGK